MGLSLADLAGLKAANEDKDINCILLFLVGGPSQLDTWDLKPKRRTTSAGRSSRSRPTCPACRSASTSRCMAKHGRPYALVRSVHHKAAPIHETGHQMMQTGRLFRGGQEHPHYGAVRVAAEGPRPDGLPPFVVLPGPIGNTGVSVSHGQAAGYLGARHDRSS